ncbi:MAG: YhcH/YjgK/YiaL family protein [Ferruginibacter sp.]
MIIDSLDNAQKYFSLHPWFQKAFSYIDSVDLAAIEPGKYEIEEDNLRAIFSNKTGMSAAESILEFECHDKHIDIQLCIHGKETIGWKPRGSCLAQKGEYNPDKDVLLYNDVPDTYFSLTDGQFVILFPEDVHAPMIGEDEIRKLVIKVKI